MRLAPAHVCGASGGQVWPFRNDAAIAYSAALFLMPEM